MKIHHENFNVTLNMMILLDFVIYFILTTAQFTKAVASTVSSFSFGWGLLCRLCLLSRVDVPLTNR